MMAVGPARQRPTEYLKRAWFHEYLADGNIPEESTRGNVGLGLFCIINWFIGVLTSNISERYHLTRLSGITNGTGFRTLAQKNYPGRNIG